MSIPQPPPGSKYQRLITQTLSGDKKDAAIVIDVYDVINAFAVRCPARQHAIKKLLCAGLRGNKNNVQDLREALGAIERAIVQRVCPSTSKAMFPV